MIENKMLFLGEIVTLISYVVFWVSRFYKNKAKMLWIDSLGKCFTIFAFVLFRNFNGINNTWFSLLRNMISIRVRNTNVLRKTAAFISLLIVLIIMCLWSFNGLSTILIFVCALLNLIGSVYCDEQGIRLYGISGGGFYMGFLYLIGNKVGFVCEFIGIIVNIVSWIKYRDMSRVKNS